MADVSFPFSEQEEELAQLHFFSIKKKHPGGVAEIRITVYEFALRNAQGMRFFAQCDQELNQRHAPFRPFGWGESLPAALMECIMLIRRYPYELSEQQ